MSLGPYLSFDGQVFACDLCDRGFATRNALIAHCRYSTRHSWCERCQRLFVSEESKAAHVRDSSAHNVCFSCGHRPDFQSYDELSSHLEKMHHWCPECELFFPSSGDLQAHDIECHNLCTQCGDYFNTQHALQTVRVQAFKKRRRAAG